MIKSVHIKDKLKQLNYDLDDICLGDFDQIGELCAKKMRSRNDPLYKSAGAFFRPNYERGILLQCLIKRFNIRSILEIGFGRGFASFCAVKTMCDLGWDDAVVYSADPNIDENHLKNCAQVFPREWFTKLNLIKGNINDALSNIDGNIDLIYIDGDHRYEAVKYDWECVKDRYTKFVLFDDYDMRTESPDIQVARFVDELNVDKELLIMDRRIFFDDRRIPDDKIDYGQVLVKHPTFNQDAFLSEW